MSTHARSPAAGWSWLMQAVNIGRSNPRAVFGAVALLALVGLVPSVIQLVLQSGLGLGTTASLAVMAACTLAMVVVYPLLIGGVLRVIDAAEHGRPTHAAALFDTFRAGSGAGRLVGFGVAMFVAYLVLFVAVVALFGQDFSGWYMELLSASTQNDPAAQAKVLQDVPDGFGTMMALGTLAGLFFSGIYAIGFGQVALAGRGVGSALVDGVAGTLKNVLPILLLAMVVFAGFLAFALALAMVISLLGMVGGLVHPALAVLLAAPVYLGGLLMLYVVMFGVMYFMWRDVCGEAAPLPPGQVEL
ncbi:hypothetical protein [Luteimonas notoginsengisoli]|uniref:Uncharacterized protein n=1 Tax=Luteimonas notoginsengisoli TaxID=1578200 RepID=A0ABV7UUJ0_9GAMM